MIKNVMINMNEPFEHDEGKYLKILTCLVKAMDEVGERYWLDVKREGELVTFKLSGGPFGYDVVEIVGCGSTFVEAMASFFDQVLKQVNVDMCVQEDTVQ